MSATLTDARLSVKSDGPWSVWGTDLFNRLFKSSLCNILIGWKTRRGETGTEGQTQNFGKRKRWNLLLL